MSLDRAISIVTNIHTSKITNAARIELQNFRDLVIAVNRYRLAHSLAESGQVSADLNDSYVNMLIICDKLENS